MIKLLPRLSMTAKILLGVFVLLVASFVLNQIWPSAFSGRIHQISFITAVITASIAVLWKIPELACVGVAILILMSSRVEDTVVRALWILAAIALGFGLRVLRNRLLIAYRSRVSTK